MNNKRLIEIGFTIRSSERTNDSKEWPTDLGGASGIKVHVSKSGADSGKGAYGAKVAEAELEASEIQDLADQVGDIKKAAAGQRLSFKVAVELGEGGATPQGILDAVNTLLAKVKKGWKLSG